jgi:hypothetical protein
MTSVELVKPSAWIAGSENVIWSSLVLKPSWRGHLAMSPSNCPCLPRTYVATRDVIDEVGTRTSHRRWRLDHSLLNLTLRIGAAWLSADPSAELGGPSDCGPLAFAVRHAVSHREGRKARHARVDASAKRFSATGFSSVGDWTRWSSVAPQPTHPQSMPERGPVPGRRRILVTAHTFGSLEVCVGKETSRGGRTGSAFACQADDGIAAAPAGAQMDDMGPLAAVAWALAYGSVRTWWAVGNAPSFPPKGTHLIAFTGWRAVGLCAAAVGITLALKAAPWRRALFIAAWVVSAALLAASAALLLDVVQGHRPTLRVPKGRTEPARGYPRRIAAS